MELEKKIAAKKVIKYINPDTVLGIGTGSTVEYLIEALKDSSLNIYAAVSSSRRTTSLLKAANITVIELNFIDELPLYIDSADEVNEYNQLLKGGGGALTREKIVASMAKKFICIIDSSKLVKKLGKFPLAIEVIPMARSFVARELVKLGGNPVYRQDFITDNGNIILDIHNLEINEPTILEKKINNIPGVVSNGIFSLRVADLIITEK